MTSCENNWWILGMRRWSAHPSRGRKARVTRSKRLFHGSPRPQQNKKSQQPTTWAEARTGSLRFLCAGSAICRSGLHEDEHLGRCKRQYRQACKAWRVGGLINKLARQRKICFRRCPLDRRKCDDACSTLIPTKVWLWNQSVRGRLFRQPYTRRTARMRD